MGPAPDPGPGAGAGPPPGGLARVLARAALPPVAVPSADAGGQHLPVIRPALFGAPIDEGPAAPSPATRVVAARRSPAVVSPPNEAAAIADPSRGPTGTVTWPPAPDVVAMDEEEHRAAPAEAGTAPPGQARPTDHGLEPEVGRPTGPRPGPAAGLTSTPGVESVPPLAAAAAAAPTAVEPWESPGKGAVVGTPEPVPLGTDQPVPQATRVSRSAPERPDRSDRSDTPAPTPAAPPVVIGRIEVHVDSPAAQTDPFAGCRVVSAGLTARRGGGW